MYFREYTDPTWELVDPSIMLLTELCSGTICLCLPTLRPLVARWLPPSLTSTAASIASHTKGGNRSTTNRSPIDNNNNPGGDAEKAALDPRRPPTCVRSIGRGGGGRRAGPSCYYNSSTTATSASSSRRPSASLPRSSASGSDSDFIYGLETARIAVPAPTTSTTSTTPSPTPLCMSIMRPMTLGSSSAGSRISRRSPVADTSSVVRFAAMPAAPFSSSSSSPAQQQQEANYYVHRNNDQGSYFRGESSGNWLLESRVSTEIGVSNSPVPSEERRALGSAAIRVKRMVTRRESVVAGW
ncbi:Satratoxin biosynthesis SC1 cluster protein 4 [Apiospora saccharicola]|uniref:Satratoxin biosynthesis SC1 cluster protein 4 n=1 Tax=Apiospora saccharicola TaxID=335842 RepID=A0ABR1UXN2_9PEZI